MTRIAPTSTWSMSIASATIVTIHSQRPRMRGTRHATRIATPASPFATIATYAQTLWKSRSVLMHAWGAADAYADAPSSCWMTSNDHSSLWLLTGPCVEWALWPCWNAALFTHASKSSWERHRVYTRYTSLS